MAAPGAIRLGPDAATAAIPRVAGQRVLRSALTPAEGAWLDQSRAIDRSTLAPSCATTCPTGWPRRCWRSWARTSSGAWPLRSTTRPRRWTCASTPSKTNARQPRLSWPQPGIASSAHAVLRPGACGWMASRRSTSWTPVHEPAPWKCRTRAASCWWLCWRPSAARWWRLCAGAGGKTLAIGAAMRNTGGSTPSTCPGHRLDAPQAPAGAQRPVQRHPAQIAHERDDRIKRLAGKIDRVLVVDAVFGPGHPAPQPDLKWRQSPESVAELQAKQRAILASAARLVKPGGRWSMRPAACSTPRTR